MSTEALSEDPSPISQDNPVRAKKTLSPEHLAKMREGRERAKQARLSNMSTTPGPVSGLSKSNPSIPKLTKRSIKEDIEQKRVIANEARRIYREAKLNGRNNA